LALGEWLRAQAAAPCPSFPPSTNPPPPADRLKGQIHARADTDTRVLSSSGRPRTAPDWAAELFLQAPLTEAANAYGAAGSTKRQEYSKDALHSEQQAVAGGLQV
jgi:hypothetical protein